MLPYNPDELTKTGKIYPAHETMYGIPQSEMEAAERKSPITPRENFELFRSHGDYCWTPSLLSDFNWVYPDVNPDSIAFGFEGGVDPYGVTWVTIEGSGLPAMVKPGNPLLKDIEDWRDVKIEDVDSWDWEASKRIYSDLDPSRPTLGVILTSFFERLLALMDFEGAAISLLEDPEEVAAFMDRMADFNISVLKHYKEAYDIDAVLVHDDWSSQNAPFFSRDTLHETILPALKRLVDCAHDLGIFFILHCCGNSESFVPDMIEAGCDGWQVQISANPHIDKTMSEYPDFFFHMIYEQKDFDELHGEELKNRCDEIYTREAKHRNELIDVCDPDWVTTPESADFSYAAARRAATERLEA